jgi:inosine/xanthosine triphosphatase
MSPIKVRVGTRNPVKVEAVRAVFSRAFGPMEVEVEAVEVDPGVPKEPFGEEIARGAVRRAKEALRDADFGVGIEAGLVWHEVLRTYFDVQFCAILDREGRLTVGHGSGFVYPPRVIEEVRKGRAVGEVMSELAGIPEIGRKEGSVGYLSRGLLTRTELTEQAVLAALIPRIRPELYI